MQFWNAFDKLLILRITLKLGEQRPVYLTLHATNGERLEEMQRWSYATTDFGLSNDGSSGYALSGKIPSELAAAIKDKLAHLSAIEPTTPLWLQFVSPCGRLPLAPFEDVLVTQLQRPVLRLAAMQAPPPAEYSQTLEVAICSSVPISKSSFPVEEYVRRLYEVFSRVPRRTTVHVFTDSPTHDSLRFQPHLSNVILHAPESAARYSTPQRSSQISTQDTIDNPWLRWVGDALENRPLDVVCFINHGYLSGDHGAIAFAQSPVQNEDAGWARFIGAAQVSRFLSQMGAWCLILGSPQENFSAAGSRMFLEEVSQSHPGYAVLHDLSHDEQFSGLEAACEALFGPKRFAEPPLHPSLTIYATPTAQLANETLFLPPGFESQPSEQLTQAAAAIQQTKVEGLSLRTLVQQTESPRWMVSAERFLTSRRLDPTWCTPNFSTMSSDTGLESASAPQDPTSDSLNQLEGIIRAYSAEQQQALNDEQGPSTAHREM